jgi:hypothetical protein
MPENFFGPNNILLPERTAVDTLVACEPDQGSGYYFAMATRILDHEINHRLYPDITHSQTPEGVLKGLGMVLRDPTVVNVNIVRAHPGTHHADKEAAQAKIDRDGVYVNELVESVAIVKDEGVEARPVRDFMARTAIDPLVGRRQPVDSDTPVIPVKGDRDSLLVVNPLTKIVPRSTFALAGHYDKD